MSEGYGGGVTTISEAHHRYPLLCPQCGCPTDGWPTAGGPRTSFCEDCVGDRDIADVPFPVSE